MAVNPLRRACVLVLVVGLVAGAGCGSASPAAATIQFPEQAVAAGATSGQEGSATTASTAEVRYGDTVTIDRSDFERELKALNDNEQLQAASGGNLSGAGKKTVDPRLASQWLTFMIQDKLVSHEVERRRLQVTPAHTEEAQAQLSTQYGAEEAVAAFPKWFRDRLIARNARAVALQASLSPVDFSEEGARKYYEEHKSDFSLNCVAHILVRSKPEADAALARVRGGEAFADVAKEVSADKGSAPKGGDLECSPKGSFVAEFDQAASELEIGKVSDPVQTQYGFHLILVKERKDVPFDSAREQVRALLNSQTQSAYRQFLREALSSVRVTVDKRYGKFEPPAPGQVPVVVPPTPPDPKTQRSDTAPATEPLEGDAPGSPDSPTQPDG
jgi:foldase protein PrsA